LNTQVTFVEPIQQFTDTQIVKSCAQQKNKSNDSDLFKLRNHMTWYQGWSCSTHKRSAVLAWIWS